MKNAFYVCLNYNLLLSRFFKGWWKYKYGSPLKRPADLEFANLRNSDFSGTFLVGANLSNSDLTDAFLYGADLTGADLAGANLTGVDLKYIKGYTQ